MGRYLTPWIALPDRLREARQRHRARLAQHSRARKLDPVLAARREACGAARASTSPLRRRSAHHATAQISGNFATAARQRAHGHTHPYSGHASKHPPATAKHTHRGRDALPPPPPALHRAASASPPEPPSTPPPPATTTSHRHQQQLPGATSSSHQPPATTTTTTATTTSSATSSSSSYQAPAIAAIFAMDDCCWPAPLAQRPALMS